MNISIARGIVKLSNLDKGSMFIHEGILALKTEYKNDNGACLCYIVGTGEVFWGGDPDLNNLNVTPVLVQK